MADVARCIAGVRVFPVGSLGLWMLMPHRATVLVVKSTSETKKLLSLIVNRVFLSIFAFVCCFLAPQPHRNKLLTCLTEPSTSVEAYKVCTNMGLP